MGIDNKPPEFLKGETTGGKVLRIFRIIGANLIFLVLVCLAWKDSYEMNFFMTAFSIIGMFAAFIFTNYIADMKNRHSINDIFRD